MSTEKKTKVFNDPCFSLTEQFYKYLTLVRNIKFKYNITIRAKNIKTKELFSFLRLLSHDTGTICKISRITFKLYF